MYNRPVQMTTLANGVRVATDHFPGPLSTVLIMIEAGSRNENFKNTGTAHFCEHLNFKGTTKRTRIQLESEIENIGGNLNAYTSRETTLYQMQVYKGLEERGIEIISDMLLNSLHEKEAVENERAVILAEEEEVMGDSKELILENVHYTAYKNHIMMLPILGNKDSINTIQRDDLKQFIYTHYLGPRTVVVGAGPVEHSQIVEIAEKYFGQLPVKTDIEIVGEDQPKFFGSQHQQKKENEDMAHMGLFYPAPSWKHKDYFAFLILQRLIGEFDPKKEGSHTLRLGNHNPLHSYFGDTKDAGKHECIYLPYKDCGLLGSFISTKNVNSDVPPMLSLLNMHRLAEHITDAELMRAKNKIYTELLNTESTEEVSQTLASQLIYMGRVVPRSEIAARVASIDAQTLSSILASWIKSNDLAMAYYGPLEMADRSYEVINNCSKLRLD
mmetsp:Transcript_5196/g.9557  ORF Transcript_5196/g.9557 Transcript_5196/m.9557 type:complete len:442 (+) Transcript_5196:154-1479(+)